MSSPTYLGGSSIQVSIFDISKLLESNMGIKLKYLGSWLIDPNSLSFGEELNKYLKINLLAYV